MKKPLLILAAVSFALAFTGPAFCQGRSKAGDPSAPTGNEPPMLGLHWERGFNPSYLQQQAHTSRSGGGSSPLMTYHGGKILTTAVTEAIFWGKSWGTYSGDEMTGMDSWYDGFSNSYYADTSDEYTGSNGQVGSDTSYAGHVVDTSAAASGNSTSSILAEVCKMIKNPDPYGNGFYAVYVDLPRKGNYCAYHSWGSCGGVPVQFAFFWKLDGDPGCDPQSSLVPSPHSEGLAALANVTAHELSEARTDPTGAGWYDSGGSENGDKCAWTFNVKYVTFVGGTNWTLQGEWSNDAYTNKFGYLNSSGQDGCLDGDSADEWSSGSP
jgi:hypothetical protein